MSKRDEIVILFIYKKHFVDYIALQLDVPTDYVYEVLRDYNKEWLK